MGTQDGIWEHKKEKWENEALKWERTTLNIVYKLEVRKQGAQVVKQVAKVETLFRKLTETDTKSILKDMYAK